jgi:mannose/fructose/N-acetylgalactosamine-specific phosphotransferase system component IID
MRNIELLRIFARLLFMQALFNRRGLQNLGLVSALSQAERLTRGGSDVLARHADYFNTNPNLAPLIVGAILRLEDERLGGKPVDEKDIASFKKALASPLAAMGDQLFLGALRPLSLTLGCLLAIYNLPIGLLAVFFLHNLAIVTCRFWGLRFGYTKGRELVEVISGSHFPRALRVVQGLGATVGGVLVGVVLHRFLGNGLWMVPAAGALVATTLYLLKRHIPASWTAVILFSMCAALAALLGGTN